VSERGTPAPGWALALDVLRPSTAEWQMEQGERFALEGVLSQVRPDLAIETGTARGGSLRRLAHHSREVHAFDLVPEIATLERELPNVTTHIGNSAQTLPTALAGFAAAGRHVDFVLIDGDHSAEGVARDITAILDSDACRRTVIVFHDTANPDVRGGLESLDLPAHPKVALCLLDFVPGYLVVRGHEQYSLAAWNGLGLVILDPEQGPAGRAETLDNRYSVAEVYDRVRPLYERD
jgi:hypothetical protein